MTAHHVAEYDLRINRGHLVEAGNAAEVIRSPQHPYTQLLVSSIPWPEPGRRWGKGIERMSPRSGSGHEDTGCAFAGPRPRVRSEMLRGSCRHCDVPYRVGLPACHLLGQATQVGAGELAELLDGA